MQKLAILILLMSATVAVHAVDLSVNDAYVRAVPPGQTRTAGF
ncbi:MAG: copper(I)-binding protein, partial [Porticoccaceae bacterium]